MTFIFDANNEKALPLLWDLVEVASDFLKKTNVLEIRKNREKDLSDKENAERNLKEMLRVVCKDFPEAFGKVCDKMWVLEDGEKAPNAIITAGKIIGSKAAIDFFISLTSLA